MNEVWMWAYCMYSIKLYLNVNGEEDYHKLLNIIYALFLCCVARGVLQVHSQNEHVPITLATF